MATSRISLEPVGTINTLRSIACAQSAGAQDQLLNIADVEVLFLQELLIIEAVVSQRPPTTSRGCYKPPTPCRVRQLPGDNTLPRGLLRKLTLQTAAGFPGLPVFRMFFAQALLDELSADPTWRRHRRPW